MQYGLPSPPKYYWNNKTSRSIKNPPKFFYDLEIRKYSKNFLYLIPFQTEQHSSLPYIYTFVPLYVWSLTDYPYTYYPQKHNNTLRSVKFAVHPSEQCERGLNPPRTHTHRPATMWNIIRYRPQWLKHWTRISQHRLTLEHADIRQKCHSNWLKRVI